MGTISEGLDIELIALHKHWTTADSVQYHLRRSTQTSAETLQSVPADVAQFAQAHSMFLALSVWYGLLYVVIEGYRELKLRDEAIDALLADMDRVSTLRRFRNGVFHYQANPIPEKIVDFITAPESEIWIRDVNRALQAFFERELRLDQVLATMGWARQDELPA